MHNILARQKHNSLPLGPVQPSSPYTKELHALVEGSSLVGEKEEAYQCMSQTCGLLLLCMCCIEIFATF